MVHCLKIVVDYYESCANGIKTFELRKNDRDYQVGDFLWLSEWDGYACTGRSCFFVVTYILRECSKYGLLDGYVILGIKRECPICKGEKEIKLHNWVKCPKCQKGGKNAN